MASEQSEAEVEECEETQGGTVRIKPFIGNHSQAHILYFRFLSFFPINLIIARKTFSLFYSIKQ